jgi:hypothetical protein
LASTVSVITLVLRSAAVSIDIGQTSLGGEGCRSRSRPSLRLSRGAVVTSCSVSDRWLLVPCRTT